MLQLLKSGFDSDDPRRASFFEEPPSLRRSLAPLWLGRPRSGLSTSGQVPDLCRASGPGTSEGAAKVAIIYFTTANLMHLL